MIMNLTSNLRLSSSLFIIVNVLLITSNLVSREQILIPKMHPLLQKKPSLGTTALGEIFIRSDVVEPPGYK